MADARQTDGGAMMRRFIPQQTKDEIVRRYQAEEIGMLTLARQYGVNLQSVSNWVRAAGVAARRRGLKIGCMDRGNPTPTIPIIHKRGDTLQML